LLRYRVFGEIVGDGSEESVGDMVGTEMKMGKGRADLPRVKEEFSNCEGWKGK